MARVNGITQFLAATHTTILTLLRKHSPDGTTRTRRHTSDIAYYSVYLHRKDECLSWPSWLGWPVADGLSTVQRNHPRLLAVELNLLLLIFKSYYSFFRPLDFCWDVRDTPIKTAHFSMHRIVVTAQVKMKWLARKMWKYSEIHNDLDAILQWLNS